MGFDVTIITSAIKIIFIMTEKFYKIVFYNFFQLEKQMTNLLPMCEEYL